MMRFLYKVVYRPEYELEPGFEYVREGQVGFVPEALSRLPREGFPRKEPFTTADLEPNFLLLEMYLEGAEHVKGLEGVLSVKLFRGDVRGNVVKNTRFGGTFSDIARITNLSEGTVIEPSKEAIECHRYEDGVHVQ